MKVSQTRTYLEIKVGTRQCVEVLLFVRQADFAWFNQQSQPEQPAQQQQQQQQQDVFVEFLQLIQNNILPRMFHDEMEDTYYRYASSKQKAPPKHIGPGGIPIAEKNNNSNINFFPTKKRKRTSKKALAELKRLQQQQQQQGDDDDNNNNNNQTKKQKDVYYAFGEHMQLAYRLQEIKDSTSRAETLVFADDDNNNKKKKNGDDKNEDNDNDNDHQKGTRETNKKRKRGNDTTTGSSSRSSSRSTAPDEKQISIAKTQTGNFWLLKKLSKRILVWCYPIVDRDESTTTTTSGIIMDAGFPRPEMIPISELFRRPLSAREEDDDNDL